MVGFQLYLGGFQVPTANIAYVGASIYPGVDVVQFTIPQGVPAGCFVPVAEVAQNVVSNIGTVAIAANGGVCSDPQYGISGTTISTLTGQSTVKSGVVIVEQATTAGASGAPQIVGEAFADFSQVTGASYSASGEVSLGGCLLTQTATSSTAIPTVTGLNAGTITVTPPSGSPITLTGLSVVPGDYLAQLPAGAIPDRSPSTQLRVRR